MNYAEISRIDVAIASGQTVSSVANLANGQTLVGLILPAALTGTTITFQRCDTADGTFVPIYSMDGASVYGIVAGTSRYVPVQPDVFSGVPFVKVVSGSAEGAARTIGLVCRNV